jgi:hypothetical protein
MKTKSRLFRTLVPTVLVGLFAAAVFAPAQTPAAGNNAVYTSSTTLAPSTAYIDASVLPSGTNTDICAKINAALGLITSSQPSAVIDARGITSPNLHCPTGDSPWVYGSTTYAKAATILLPAGTIVINSQWVMPSGAVLIGEGGGAASTSASAGVTTIQACKSGVTGCSATFSASAMIAMGSNSTTFCPSNVCTGVSIQNVWVDGQAIAALNGIANSFSAEQSTVRHVTLYQISGTGLNIFQPTSGSGTPLNSGPYEDILCLPGSAAATGTACARILNVSTRGIHGLTCINTSSTIPTVAVALNAPNNTLEDIEVQGFQNGVRIGGTANAENDLLVNITGGTGVTSVVEISSGNTVNNIGLLGIGNGGSATYTISDSISTPAVNLSDATVAAYFLGEQMTSGSTPIGFSRFTTSQHVAAWIQGSAAPSAPCPLGSLYSDTSAVQTGHPYGLYVCTPSGSSTTWSGVK